MAMRRGAYLPRFALSSRTRRRSHETLKTTPCSQSALANESRGGNWTDHEESRRLGRRRDARAALSKVRASGTPEAARIAGHHILMKANEFTG